MRLNWLLNWLKDDWIWAWFAAGGLLLAASRIMGWEDLAAFAFAFAFGGVIKLDNARRRARPMVPPRSDVAR